MTAPWIWNRFLTLLRCQDLLGLYEEALIEVSRFKREQTDLERKNALHLRALEGYFEGAAGRLPEGIARLNDLLLQYPDLGVSHPRVHTYVQRVLGQHLARVGHITQARYAFAKALRSTRTQAGGRSPHAELEILTHYAQSGLAHPRQIRRLLDFPVTSPSLFGKLSSLRSELVPTSDREGEIAVRWTLDTQSGEMIHKGRIYPESPKELLLAALLVKADITGLSLTHACMLLWRDEAWNWIQLQDRIP